MNTDILVQELTRDEGKRNKSYRDTVGKWTIGVGRNLTDVGLRPTERAALLANSPNRSLAWPALVITDAEITMLLENDIAVVIKELDTNLPWWVNLCDARQRVLANMCFNMGVDTLLTFKNTLRLIKDGEYGEAADAMLESKWARQVGARANRLAQMMREGD